MINLIINIYKKVIKHLQKKILHLFQNLNLIVSFCKIDCI